MTEQQKAAAALTLLGRATFQLSEMDAVREVHDWLRSVAEPTPVAVPENRAPEAE